MRLNKKHFIDFTIVFLAVFLGALAENYREDYQETKQGREYISRFYQDIYSDLSKINETLSDIEMTKYRLLQTDSLKYDRPSTPEEFLRVYSAIRSAKIWVTPDYIPNSITIEQIKHTGAWDFIDEEYSQMVTSYQISSERIRSLNIKINNDIRETFNLVKKTPTDLIRYNPEDFSNRELQNLHNYIHELYWSHFGYSVVLNQHKYFIIEIIQKLATDPNVIKNNKAYDITANIISIVELRDDNTFKENDQILTETAEQSNIWNATLDLTDGRYVFRKGISFDIRWGIPSNQIDSTSSGKIILNDGNAFQLSRGKYFVQLSLKDSTYLISKME